MNFNFKAVSLAGRLFYTWLYPSEVISLGWLEEMPKPLDHYTSQELQRSKIKRNKTKQKKNDVGVSRWPRWAFKLRAVQYAHLGMYHQIISSSLLPRYSEKAIFNRLVYTASQNCVQTHTHPKNEKQQISPRTWHISTQNSQCPSRHS